MVKNVESWISDFKAGALYLYITLPTPKEVRRGEVHLHVPLRHACVRFFSCTPVGAPAGPALPSSMPGSTEPALTPSHDTARWPVGCPGSATPALSSWTRPGCPLQSGWFPCLSSTPSGQWHPPRAHLWSVALQEVKSAHLKQTGSFPSSGARQGVPGLEARPTCGDDVLMLRAIQIGTADAVQGTV